MAKRRKSKGSLNLLILGPVFIIVSGLIASVLSSTMASVQTSITKADGSTAVNQTVNMATHTLTGVQSVSSQYGTIGLIIVASIIIGLIFTYVLSRFLGKGGGL